MTSGVYLLHFTTPYKHARHYIGYAKNVEDRIAEHLTGKGARLPAVVAAANILIISARIWPGKDRAFERSLKNRKNAARLCPVCNKRTYQRNAPCYTVRDQDVDL